MPISEAQTLGQRYVVKNPTLWKARWSNGLKRNVSRGSTIVFECFWPKMSGSFGMFWTCLFKGYYVLDLFQVIVLFSHYINIYKPLFWDVLGAKHTNSKMLIFYHHFFLFFLTFPGHGATALPRWPLLRHRPWPPKPRAPRRRRRRSPRRCGKPRSGSERNEGTDPTGWSLLTTWYIDIYRQ